MPSDNVSSIEHTEKKRFGFLLHGRMYLVIGSILLLASMPLQAFSNSKDAYGLLGIQLWGASASGFVLVLGITPFTVSAFLCATWNIPQLILTFVSGPEGGTTPFLRWSFAIITIVVLPFAALTFMFMSKYSTDYFYYGYYLYQAGYIFTTTGLWIKKRNLKTVQRQQVSRTEAELKGDISVTSSVV